MNKFSLAVLLIAIFAILKTTLAGPVQAQAYLAEVNGPACPLCTLFVGKVKDVVQDYEGRITDEFKNKVCGKLPQSMRGICNYFVEDYGKQVIESLLNKVEPKKVCTKIGLCDDANWFRKYVTDTQAYIIYMDLIKMGDNADGCALCKYAVSMIEDYINGSRDEIETQLLNVCKNLSPSIRQVCDTIVLLYGRQIIDYLLAFGSPEKVCQQIRLCPTNDATFVIPEEFLIPEEFQNPEDFINEGTVQCELCKYVINLAQEYIRSDATEEKIKEALGKICNNFLPIKRQCLNFVDTYQPLIIEFLLQKLPADEVCKKIKLCAVEMPLDNDMACPLCKMVVGAVVDYLEKNETIDFIKEKVTTLCNYLPSEYSGMCKFLADQYIVQIVHYLEQQIQPDVICEKIRLCPATHEPFIGLPMRSAPMRVN